MATKIRLQRRGRKDYPFYQIIIADSRAPRDGKFIEKVGSYNPNTNPATITLDFDRALYWLQVGAQPTDTVRNILSGEGVLMMKHLLGGVRKGAFTEEQAKAKFEAWKASKEKAVDVLKNKNAEKERAEAKERLEAEKATNKAKAEELAQKKAEANAAAAEASAEAAAEDVVEEVKEEVAAAPETEAPAAEAVVEAAAEEVKEEAAAAPEAETPAAPETEAPAAEEKSAE